MPGAQAGLTLGRANLTLGIISSNKWKSLWFHQRSLVFKLVLDSRKAPCSSLQRKINITKMADTAVWEILKTRARGIFPSLKTSQREQSQAKKFHLKVFTKSVKFNDIPSDVSARDKTHLTHSLTTFYFSYHWEARQYFYLRLLWVKITIVKQLWCTATSCKS